MKEIKLTRSKVAIVDDEDYEFLNQWKWLAAKYPTTFYARRIKYSNGRQINIQMHRIIMNAPDDMFIDHIDGNGLNNQKNNLRFTTRSNNSRNKRKKSNSKSKYLGVSWHRTAGKWQAMIMSNGISVYLGIYLNEDDAAKAYNEAAVKHHKEYAKLNNVVL